MSRLNNDHIWAGTTFPGCFLLLPRILLAFKICGHYPQDHLFLFSLLHSSRPFKADAKSQPIVLDDAAEPALHQSSTPDRTRVDISTIPEKRVEHRSPQLWPLHTSPSPLSPPPRAASSRFRAQICAISLVSVPSVVTPSYAVGDIAKLSRWLIPSSSSSSPLHPRP